MCCTFNMRAADDIFNGKSYSNLVMKLQDQDRKGTFVESSPPLFYKDEPKSRFLSNENCSIEIISQFNSNLILGIPKNILGSIAKLFKVFCLFKITL